MINDNFPLPPLRERELISAADIARDLNEMMALDETPIANLLLHEVSVPAEFSILDDQGLNVRTRKQGPFEHHSIRVIDLMNYLFRHRGLMVMECRGQEPVGERYFLKLNTDTLEGQAL